MKNSFNEIYEESIQNPEKFWKNVSDDIFWFKKPTKILNKSNSPFYKWFEDGVTNTCYNAIDIHIDNILNVTTTRVNAIFSIIPLLFHHNSITILS